MLSDAEFGIILNDRTKRIVEDIVWQQPGSYSQARRCQVQVKSTPDWSLALAGWWNPVSEKLSFSLLLNGSQRILGLCMGSIAHTNPDGQRISGTHKHRWNEEHKDGMVYVPDDITALWSQPIEVLFQFCAEANILMTGDVPSPSYGEELGF